MIQSFPYLKNFSHFFDSLVRVIQPVVLLFVLLSGLMGATTVQATPPPKLAPFQCIGCTDIQLFYCQGDPAPVSPDAYIQANTNYISGATIHWYYDFKGIQGAPVGSTPVPNVGVDNTHTFWVSQSIGGNESPVQRVQIIVEKRPLLSLGFSCGLCRGSSMALADILVDIHKLTERYEFFDVDPSLPNATPFAIASASNGVIDPNQPRGDISPVVNTPYWVVGHNLTSFNSCSDTTQVMVIIRDIPVFNNLQNLETCSGGTLSPAIIRTTPYPGTISWQNTNPNVGLPVAGKGHLPSFTTPINVGASPITSEVYITVTAGSCYNTDTIQVIVNPAPVMAPGLGQSVCSDAPANLTLATANGLSGVQFNWSAPVLAPGLGGIAIAGSGTLLTDHFTNQTNTSLPATYWVDPVSAKGCPGTGGQVTLDILPEPVLTTGLTEVVCSGNASNLVLNISNGLPNPTFNWASPTVPVGLVSQLGGPSAGPGSSIQDVFLNLTTTAIDVTYKVTPTDQNGCSGDEKDVIVEVLPLAFTPQMPFPVCEQSLGSGSATVDLTELDSMIRGGPNVTYFLDPFLQAPIANSTNFLSNGGVVYAKTTGNGTCPLRTAIDLIILPLPAAPIVSDTALCEGGKLRITPVPVPGQTFNFYDADPASGSAQLLSANSTGYGIPAFAANSPVEIWVTADNGNCESPAEKVTVTIFPNPTNLQVLANGPLCEGQDLLLSASATGASAFAWTGPNQFSGSNASELLTQVSPSAAGTYYLTATSSANCSVQDSVSLVVVPLGDAGKSSTLNYCDGDAVFNLFDRLGGTPDAGGDWSGPSGLANGYLGTFDPATMTPGVYTYSILPQGPCTQVVSTTVTLNSFPIPTASILTNAPIFEGDDLILSATGGTSYLWTGPNNFTSTDPSLILFGVTAADSGNYMVTVTNAGGCQASDTTHVSVRPVPAIRARLGAWLEGPFVDSVGLMRDDLRKKGLIPLTEPFSAIGYKFVTGGGETIDTTVLQVTGPNAIVDWVAVELRNANDSSQIMASKAFLIQRDGDIVDVDGSSAPAFPFISPDNYYITLRHRNHLGIMTDSPIALAATPGVPVDFRDPNTGTFGFLPRKIVNGMAFLYAGDANFDGEIQVLDLTGFWFVQVGATGYLESDWDLDGNVQNDDFLDYWTPNSGRSSQVP